MTTTASLQLADTVLGPVLADAQRRTLYALAGDATGPHAAALWEPVGPDGLIDVGPGLEGHRFGAVRRADGTRQLTVGGRPLYRFAGDRRPGDVAGHGAGLAAFAVGAEGGPAAPFGPLLPPGI